MTFVALLRGINVSGQKRILMADLKALYEAQPGFEGVRAYIQSGNVVFRSPQADPAALEAQLARVQRERFGFEVETFVLPASTLRDALEACPFRDRSLAEGENVYFSFLSGVPEAERAAKLLALENADETPALVGSTFFLFCRHGYHKSAFGNNILERTLKLRSTTRNLATVKTLVGWTAELGLD